MNDLELREFPYHNEACGNCKHSAEMHGIDCTTKEQKCFQNGCECKGFVTNPDYHAAAKIVNETRFKRR